ncbi:biotin synthase [Blastocladiella emersonii ATCC 22665]|nr:biotin synthase [Blastocladiella emersonii ATCC 22665]
MFPTRQLVPRLAAAASRSATRAASRAAPRTLAAASIPRVAGLHSSTTQNAVEAPAATTATTASVPPPAPVDRRQDGRAQSGAAFHALNHTGLRYNWTREEIAAIYNSPIMDLLFYGSYVHRHHHDPLAVQQCTLLSIKTGGCSEDCSYCPQSSKHSTSVKASKMLGEDEVLSAARRAKEAGSTRFCMGAAWRSAQGRKTNFKQVLNYVTEIRGMGMEVCCTLGMLDAEQAKQLKDAGLSAYNHNLDTSREFYPKIITTRSYDDRLDTLANVRDAGIHVCSGGIIGLGESADDRVGMLHTLSTLPKHPESVPVNALVAVQGTPLEKQDPVPVWDLVRMIATARIVMPGSMVRLSAGRVRLSMTEQTLCFMAGANSIFTGEKLLTTDNNDWDTDKAMFDTLGLIGLKPDLVKN